MANTRLASCGPEREFCGFVLEKKRVSIVYLHTFLYGRYFFFFLKGPKFEQLYFGNIILPVLQMWGFRLEEIRLF